MKGDQTLGKLHRIRRSSEYILIRQEGERHHTAHFIVIVKPGRQTTRLGLTVSRKVGNAVCRNQLKRWVRELFRTRSRAFSGAIDISIIAKNQAGSLNHAQVDRELLKVFARLETDDYV